MPDNLALISGHAWARLATLSESPKQSEMTHKMYNPIEHLPYNIYGRASYFKGFDEMQLQVGSYLKAGFSFEFSKKDDVIRSIETGVSLDAFKVGDNNIVGDALGKELPVMAITKNKKTFFSFYINMNFFFGKKW